MLLGKGKEKEKEKEKESGPSTTAKQQEDSALGKAVKDRCV